MQPRHLVVSISGHGFGHVAQTAPILNALHRLSPDLRITVRSSVANQHLRSRICAPFTHLQSSGDIGMAMTSAVAVDVEKSRAAYQHFHSHWDESVSAEARLLQELGADMVFSNVGYLPLAGAQRIGIPNAALCSLNWYEIYRHYCGTATTGSAADQLIIAQIQTSYANADAFLRTTPGMAMSGLDNLMAVAPIAELGANRRDELNQLLQLPPDEKLLLVSMGGIQSRLAVEDWPSIKGVRYLVQKNWQVRHPDAIDFDDIPLSFNELLSSADALLCKPGYGSFVEAACSRIPVLYLPRPDWPESPALISWLKQNGVSRLISTDELQNMAEILDAIWCSPKPAAVIPDGAEQVARWLAGRLA